MQLVHLEWADVRPDENQPRKIFDADHLEALEATYRQRGQLVPALVKADASGATPYVLIDGECRYRVGSKLHTEDPDNALFATFPAYVLEDIVEDDLVVVQYIANTGAEHTPAEKMAVMKRLIDRGVSKNKLRGVLGITRGQYRYLKEYLQAPTWMHAYGEPKSVRVPITSNDGSPIRGDDGKLATRETTVPALPLTHLATLSRAAARLVKWDQQQQSANPEGDHTNVAQKLITGLAEKSLREGWTAAKLTKQVANTVDRVLDPSPTTEELMEAFSRTASGGLRIPTLDPTRMTPDGVSSLVQELESIITQLRSHLDSTQAAVSVVGSTM